MVKLQFAQWEDSSKNPTRVITLNANKQITAQYVEVIEMSYEPADSPTGTAQITKATKLTLSPLTAKAKKGTTTTFTGKLTDDADVPISGKTIHFFVDGVDTGSSGVTNATGEYSINYTWNTMGTFTYQAKYLGD